MSRKSAGPDAPAARDDAVLAVERQVVALLSRVRGDAANAAHRLHSDLTVSAYRILLRINDVDDARVTDLAGHFQVGKPTMSRQVAALEELDLVARRPDPADGRGALVSLTDAGRVAFADARRRRHEWIGRMLTDFDDDEVTHFAGQLARFVRPEPPD